MAGGIIQLISCGLHDVYLIGNPQITFFKKVYNRYTHFAMESIFLPVDGTIGYNQYTSIQIPRTGDLLRNIIIEMKLGHEFKSYSRANGSIRVYSNGVLNTINGYFSINSQNQYIITDSTTNIEYVIKDGDNNTITTTAYPTTFDLVIGYEPMLELNKYRPRVGHRLMDYVELMIGSQIIDRQESKWIDIWKQVALNYEKWELTKQMSNAAVLISRDESRTYIELPFWFSKNIGLSLPLIALQYHDVRCNVKYTEPISWTSTNELNSISDHDNPSYVCGKFNGILTLGDIVLDTFSSAINVESGYVAKVSAGGWEWAKKIDYIDTSSNNVNVNALKVRDLSNGDIVVAGVYSGRIRFEGSTFELSSFDRSQDVFIAKIDQYGTWLSASSAGGSEFDQVYGLDIDVNGNIYVSGYYAGLAYFDQSVDGSGITITSSSCTNDIFIAKLRYDMKWEWAHTATGYNIRYTDSGNGVIVDDTDPSNVNVYVAGNFTNDTSFNPVDPSMGWSNNALISLQRGEGDISNATSDNFMGAFVAQVGSNGWKWVNYLKTDISKSATQFININGITLTKDRQYMAIVGNYDGSYNFLDDNNSISWGSKENLQPMTNSDYYRNFNVADGEAMLAVMKYRSDVNKYVWVHGSVLDNSGNYSYKSANDVSRDISGGIFVVGQTIQTQNTGNLSNTTRSFIMHIPDIRDPMQAGSFYKFITNTDESQALSVSDERDGYVLVGGEFKKRFFITNSLDLSSNINDLDNTYVHSYVMKYNTFKTTPSNIFEPTNCEWLYGGRSSQTGGGIYGRSQVSSVVQAIKPSNVNKMAYLSNRDFILDGTIYYDHDLLINDGRAYGDYIYLDTEERRLYANLKHEYLIEQMQYSQQFILDRNYTMTDIHFNHPVKELFWTYQLPDNRRTFDYWDGSGNDLLQIFSIQYNGVNRLVNKDPGYLRLVQPYFHHSGGLMQNKATEEGGYYTYSFALKPEQYQPTGTSNFSRIDNVILHHTVSRPCLLDVYATNYNILRITSGMAGVAYSN